MKKFWGVPCVFLLAIGFVLPASADVYTTSIDSATYGVTGYITFDDWGYTGPNGRTAMDFGPVNGFGANPLDPTGGIGQIQHVITRSPDKLTPDAPNDIYIDWMEPGNPFGVQFPDTNMDANVNFYHWGYTSPGGQTFNNMRIDYDGDYLVDRTDMNFLVYNGLDYTNEGTNPSAPPDGFYTEFEVAPGATLGKMAFQPYAIEDATGWCGSVLASHPNALDIMAGQLTFDFAFEAFMAGDPVVPGSGSIQLVPDFMMRSYGSLEIHVDQSNLTFNADAVVNNTNPGNTDRWDLDPAYHNLVSFMGGSVVPTGVWTSADSYNPDGSRKYVVDGAGVARWAVTIVPAGTPGAVWYKNSFAGYPFLLRADGERFIDWFDEAVYGPDPFAAAVPEPGSILLTASGLVGLLAVRRQRW